MSCTFLPPDPVLSREDPIRIRSPERRRHPNHPGIEPERQVGGQVYGQHLDEVKAGPGETVMVLKIFFGKAQGQEDGPHNEPGGDDQVGPRQAPGPPPHSWR